MPNPLKAARRKTGVLVVATAVLGVIVSGCDLQEDADTERGRTLFQTKCGTCHALAEAGTNAQIGPDLDASFAAARETGMDQDTIEGVVERQIALPRLPAKGDPDYDQVFMPADIVTGRDAVDVSAYIASVAGVPGIAPPPLGTASNLFLEKCGGCHTFEAAGSAGTTGPVLDEVLPGQTAEMIYESIRDPLAKISPGFEGVQMPVFDEGQIPDANLNALVAYLLACTKDPDGDVCTQAGDEEEASALPSSGSGKK